MTELTRIDPPVILSSFDDARLQVIAWQKEFPAAPHIVMILDAKDTYLAVAGPAMRQSDIAGLCFAAANMALR